MIYKKIKDEVFEKMLLEGLEKGLDGKEFKVEDSETNKRETFTSDKKLSEYQIMSAIATAAYQTSQFTDSFKRNSFDEDSDVPYWVECPLSQGLKFKFKNNKLVLILSKELLNPLKLNTAYDNKISTTLDKALADIKKRFKEITGKTLTLTAETDIVEQVVPLSLVRQIRVYSCMYKIGNVNSALDQEKEDVKEIHKSALDKAEAMTVFKKKSK